MVNMLSPSEMESLLAAADSPHERSQFGNAARFARSGSPGILAGHDCLQALTASHQKFAAEFATKLSALLRSTVEVRLVGIDQMAGPEFASAVEDSTCLTIIDAATLSGPILLELSTAIVFPILDRLFGGGKSEQAIVPRRPLTEIESRLLSRVTDLAIIALSRSWSDHGELDLRRVLENAAAQFAPILSASAGVVVIHFDVKVGAAIGNLNICWPADTFSSLAARLAKAPVSGKATAAGTQNTGELPQSQSRNAPNAAAVELRVQLASTRLTCDDVANLEVGDVIMTESNSNRPLTVYVDGEPKFSGFAGLVRGRKAVRIVGVGAGDGPSGM
jgi:flagellar motor switch protein FliM